MSSQISGSVGRWEKGAQNLKEDVKTVQSLLVSASKNLQAPEINPNGVDGKITKPSAKSDTVSAIEAFQCRFTRAVDGLIQPSSQTWDALLQASDTEPAVQQESGATQQFLFPFPTVPAQSWEQAPRVFASSRASGSRLHAGCDLYFPQGTFIHAVGDGVVTRGPYPFYCETFALEIDHGSFLARYGEIQSKTEACQGDRVQAGQRIARVGHLIGIKVPSDMLHFELYDKTLSGPLTVVDPSESAMRKGVSFMRRKDLMDPTMKLNQWQAHLP
jgi:murein DD-endopeptidase MepM/ murein hydrolase activator NlpD